MNKKDKGLELLAEMIAEDMEKEIEEIEQLDVEVPEELHNKMLEFVRELDRKDAEQRKKQIRTRMVRFAAVFTICFITMGSLTLGTSDAFRERVFSLFYNEDSGSVTLRNQNEYDFIGDWDDFWYPNWMPKGYYLLGADKNEQLMLFVSDSDDSEIRILESSLNSSISYDTETTNSEKIKINQYNGIIFSDQENNMIHLVWFTSNHTIEIRALHYNDVQSIIKIAENMSFVSNK